MVWSGVCRGLVVSLLVVGFGLVPALAEEKVEVYTQVGSWDIPREKWGAFVKFFETYEKPVLEKMVAEGVLLEWGIDANGLHDPDDYSHSTWSVARSLGDLEKSSEAYYQSLGANADRLEAEFAAMITKHRDMVYVSEHQAGKAARLDRGYFQVTSVQVKRGMRSQFLDTWNELQKPVFEKLLQDGTIVSYGLDTLYFHTTADSLGRMFTWYVIADMADDAKVESAFDAAADGRSASQRMANRELYWSLVEEGSHRDGFSRIIHYQRR